MYRIIYGPGGTEMARQAGRRKVRKRKSKTENSGVKLSSVAVIMLVAVLLGFLTARFVIGPVIGYNVDESQINVAEKSEEGSQKKDDIDDVDAMAEPEEGYALQFGAFSTREAAQSLSDLLKSKGIKTEVVEIDSVFKVISPVTEDKNQVMRDLNEVKEKDVTDVFIASF